MHGLVQPYNTSISNKLELLHFTWSQHYDNHEFFSLPKYPAIMTSQVSLHMGVLVENCSESIANARKLP